MRTVILFFFILVIHGVLGAQAVLDDIRFIPPTFFVGDHVEIHITFKDNGSTAVAVPDPVPESEWAEITDISINQDEKGFTVVLSFIPFAPGTRTMPPMQLGTLELKNIKVPTHSLIENTHEGVRSLRGQVLIPGTRLAVALILFLVAMAPFLAYGLFRFFWKWIRKSRQLYKVGRPARQLRHVLKKLKSGIGSTEASLWYYELTEALRSYLSTKRNMDCRSATTAEIALMPVFLSGESPQQNLLEVLKEGDMVKFAGCSADNHSLTHTLDVVISAVGEWEKDSAQL